MCTHKNTTHVCACARLSVCVRARTRVCTTTHFSEAGFRGTECTGRVFKKILAAPATTALAFCVQKC